MQPLLQRPGPSLTHVHRYQKLKKFTKVYDKIEELRGAGRFHEVAEQVAKARALDGETPFFVTECGLAYDRRNQHPTHFYRRGSRAGT